MKSFLSFVAVCALACTLSGCKSNKTEGAASPGAVGEKKSECCEAGKTDANMGAVGEKKDGCCAGAKADASMGAVSEKKEGGCCSKAKSDASLGAVSEKKSCTGVCPVTGKPLS